jgi:hypothetical protein
MQDKAAKMGTTFNYNRATLISIFTLSTCTKHTKYSKKYDITGKQICNKYLAQITVLLEYV